MRKHAATRHGIDVLRFARAVVAHFMADRGGSLAASLTYTTLLALVPLLTIALGLMTAFPVFETYAAALERFLQNDLLPPAVGETVLAHLREFSAGAARLTAVGLAILAVSAYLMIHTLERAFNDIWGVRKQRPIAMRMLVYWGVVTLGPLLLGASLTLTSHVVSRWLGLARDLPWAQTVLLTAAPMVLTSVALTLLYYVVPNRAVAFRHALAGGVVAALLFDLGNRLFGLYIAEVSSYTLVYGAFAAVPLFLVWVYLSWTVTILGAEVVALLPDYRIVAREPIRPPVPALDELLPVLRVLVLAQHGADQLPAARIAKHAGVPLDAAERLLEMLGRAGWAVQAADGRWMLACDPDVVTIAEVRDSLVSRGSAGLLPGTVSGLLARADAGVRNVLTVPLRALVEPPPVVRPPARSRRGRASR